MTQPRSCRVLVAVACLLSTFGCDDVKKSAELKAAEAIGDIATERLAAAGETSRAANDLINVPIEVRQLHEIVWQVRGVANTQMVATPEGNVVFDTGLATQAAKQRRLLGEAVPGKITHVILSHSHQDHAGGTGFWTEAGTEIVAHEEYLEEQRYLKALEPEMIVPSHNDPIEGKDGIRAALIKMRDAVQYVHDEVIAGMNAGKTVYELMAEVELPPDLELSQVHGRVSWGVKSIWEYYATWFHFDTTTELYPVPASKVWSEVRELVGADALVARANAHIEAGRNVEGLHLLEFVLADGNNHRSGLEARKQALEELLDQSQDGLDNSYENDWLRYRLRDTEARLEATDA